MPRAAPAVLAFNAGELSPRLDGRTDLEKYSKGCRALRNFLPLVQGGVTKRLGSLFVLEAPNCRRLVPFVFNASDATVLAFYAQAIEFFRSNIPVFDIAVSITGVTQANPAVVTTAAPHGMANGDHVFIDFIASGMTELGRRRFTIAGVTATTFQLVGVNSTGYGAYTSGGTASRIYRLATPFDSGGVAVDALQFAGQNDVLYMACPTHPPMKLSRFGATDWTIEEVEFDYFPFSPENLDEESFVAVTGTSTTSTVSLISSSGIFTAAMVGAYVKLREIPEAFNPEWKPAPEDLDATKYLAFQANAASWEVGDCLQYEGRVYECARRGASGVTGSVPPTHDSGFASDGSFDWEFKNFGYGYARITAFTDAFRVDVDVIVPMPLSTVSIREFCSASATNPITVTTTTNHDWETGDKVFFRDLTGTIGTALNNTLQMITRTGATTFTVPVNGAPLAGGLNGAVWRMDVARNATGANGKIYPSLFRWSFGAWDAVRGYPRAVTFFEDRLCWAGTNSNPQSIWMSRPGRYEDHATFDDSDSALLVTLSSSDPIEWMRDSNGLIVGTAGSEFSTERNSTEPLSAESVNTIRQRSQYGSRRGVAPALIENVVVFVQARGLKLRELVYDDAQGGLVASDLTRLADHLSGLGLVKEMAFAGEPFRTLWCVLTTGIFLGFTYERDEQVFGWHRHSFGGTDSKVISAAVIPHPLGDQDQTWLLVERTIGGVSKRYVERIVGRIPANGITNPVFAIDRFYADSGVRYVGGATAQVTGLVNWAGETFQASGDGVYLGEFVVPSNGTIVLPVLAEEIVAGYGYDAVLSPMRLEAGSADGTAQGKTKRVVALRVRLHETGRGLVMGPTEDTATEEIVIGDSELKSGDTDLLPWPGGWESDGVIVLKHDKPTPCEITSILPRMQTND
jgi:hypothetical protein